jgi:hypothetical protein
MRKITIEPKGDPKPGFLRYKAEVKRGIYIGSESVGIGLDICSKTLLMTLTQRSTSENGHGEAPRKDGRLLKIYEYEGADLRPSDLLHRDILESRTIEIPDDGDVVKHIEREVNGIYNDTLLKRLLLRK